MSVGVGYVLKRSARLYVKYCRSKYAAEFLLEFMNSWYGTKFGS